MLIKKKRRIKMQTKIRRSTAEELLNGCQLAGFIALSGVEIFGNSNTSAGTAGHKQIEEELKNGIIPDNIKFAVGDFSPADFIIEQELTIEKDGVLLSCTPDAFIIKNNKAVIFDWKFTQSSEQYVIDGYKYKTFQPLWYAFLLFANYEEVETIMFQYVLPRTQDIINPVNYNVVNRAECYDDFQMNIFDNLISFLANKDNPKKDYSKCLSCFYANACPEMNLNKLEIKSDITLKADFKITQQNAGDVYNLCSKLEKAVKELKERIKNAMEIGEITTFNISDSKCIELIEKAGAKRLNKDLLNSFLSTYNKSYDDFTEQSEPIKSLQQKKIKAV